jgi:hypothetical protein
MQRPRRDERGVIPHDHEEIAASEDLIRYIPPVHVKYENGIPILSSAAFSPSSPPNDPRSSVSVDAKKLLLVERATPPYRARSNEGYAELNVGQVRGLELQVGWDPLLDNAAHCGIWGIGKFGGSKRKAMQRQLRDIASVGKLPAV